MMRWGQGDQEENREQWDGEGPKEEWDEDREIGGTQGMMGCKEHWNEAKEIRRSPGSENGE